VLVRSVVRLHPQHQKQARQVAQLRSRSTVAQCLRSQTSAQNLQQAQQVAQRQPGQLLRCLLCLSLELL
jgi:hypothetical protein